MAKASSPGQGVDDLVRRSAGIPAAFLALFEAEPEGAPKRLLKKAMPWLLSWARGEPPGNATSAGEAEETVETTPQEEDRDAEGAESKRGERSHPEGSEELIPGGTRGVIEGEKVTGGEAPSGYDEGKKAVGGRQRVVKTALEGMVPQVHAFNTLRVAFGNTNLGTDTSGFAAEGLMVAVRGFASPHWEVSGSCVEGVFFCSLLHGHSASLQRGPHCRDDCCFVSTGFFGGKVLLTIQIWTRSYISTWRTTASERCT